MNLTYRGIPYQPSNNSYLQPEKTSIKAKYRGLCYQIGKEFKNINKPFDYLIYRGIKYHQNKSNSTFNTQKLKHIFH